MSDDIHFQVSTPLNFQVRVTYQYWQYIISVKHPIMAERESEVEEALQHPDEIRVSRSDPNAYLFYRLERARRWVCAVAKRLNSEGFLITTYLTDAIKEGTRVWPR
jgi:hypothetical protein